MNTKRFRGVMGDVLSLFFPQFCAACSELLMSGEELVCTRCRFGLPYTGFHKYVSNPVAKQFWGKVMLRSAAAYLYFQKGGRVQQMMHKLKYGNEPEIGEMLGCWYGGSLKGSFLYHDVTAVVPVPLHRDRLKKRGYNQAEMIANGLSTTMGVPAVNDLLLRSTATATQTRKNRYERYKNVEEVFCVGESKTAYGHHVLLVDDVITTGSTLTACASVLRTIPNVEVSIAALAFAER